MKALYLEPFSGLSGDMFNGLLLDLGGNLDQLKEELENFKIGDYTLQAERINKSNIFGMDFDVQIANQAKDTGIKGDFDHHHDHHDEHHSHEHDHEHTHPHDHEHNHEHSHEHAAHHHHHHESRGLTEILGLIEGSNLSDSVKKHSSNVFKDIARAEAAVHNADMNKIHFHEIGAVDSIVDIVSFFILWEQLGIDKVYSTPITEGSGTIRVAHGEMPIPVPAVMQLRKNYPLKIVQDFEIKTELVTPTGLALFKEIAPEFNTPDNMYFSDVGYGFGKRETGKFNALRGSLLTIEHSNQEVKTNNDDIIKIEANLDDQTPEQIGYAIDLLLEHGALDVFCSSIQMKKNRPATLLNILVKPELFDEISYLVFKHTNTAGFRYQKMQRRIMERAFKEVQFENENLRIKKYQYQDIEKFKPEFDDCEKIATKNDWSLQETYKKIQSLY